MKKYSIIGIFIFAIFLRLWNLNQMGRTWDEEFYVERAYTYIDLIKKGDFTNSYWYRNEASGFPPVSKYLYGITSILDIQNFDSNGKAIFNYDYTYARLLSVLFSCGSVILVVLLGWKFISPTVGVISGIILAMLPIFMGFSQLATLESLIVFFFTATIFSFLNFLTRFSIRNILFTGFLLGLALGIKYTNILLVPLMIWIFFIFYFHNIKNKDLFKKYIYSIIAIFAVALITFFVIWPMPWFHLNEVIAFNKNLRYSPYSVPEVFFGKLILIPKVYYFVYFLITTPLGILILFLLGLKSISNRNLLNITKSKFKITKFIYEFFFFIYNKTSKKNKLITRNAWVLYALVAWFIFPFIQSIYNYKQHGIRYIIEIYAPLALITAVGFEYLVCSLPKFKYIRLILTFTLITYLLIVIVHISPYYLDYFNIFVGGAKNVYEKRMFQLGSWGQGVREAAYYVKKNAVAGSTIGIAISPSHVMPPLPQMRVEKYNPKGQYNYVIVNLYNVLREGFDDSKIKKEYDLIFTVKADGAELVYVYQYK